MKYQEWKKANSTPKKYAHFDVRVSIADVERKIRDQLFIIHHGFYPLIHYTQVTHKYKKGQRKKDRNDKKRDICYCAHIDRCIYQYYAYLLNERYNDRVLQDGIHDSAVAYRNNLGMTNIHFSKIAFDCIKRFPSCYIMIGDFTDFFGNLEHGYLKQQLCGLLGQESLPDDYYAVFKNITRYSTWELSSLLEINHLQDTAQGRRKLNRQRTVLTQGQFHQFKKSCIQKHESNAGIPQGSPISAVLANIYMLEADKMIHDYVIAHSGMYMRYSDDFIIIEPVSCEEWREHYQWIKDKLNAVPGIKLQPDKTKLFQYVDDTVISCNSEFEPGESNGQNKINFLGFSFDGKEITIRDKTVSKYYHKMYRKARYIPKHNYTSPKGHKITCKNLYLLYSIKGSVSKRGADGTYIKHGNFLTYVRRAQTVFQGEPITRSTDRHMLKIRRALNSVPSNKNGESNS